MPTTFNITQFKNGTLNSLLGKSAPTYPAFYVQFFNGTQPADPTVAPAGTAVFSGYTAAVIVNGSMAAPALGISAMSGSHSANATNAVASITFARIYDSGGTAIIDTPVSLVGGGGGVIVPILSSSVGVAFQMDAFSIKMPLANGTILLSAALANALASLWAIAVTNIGLGASANINIYSGTAPATADAPATGTLLASFSTGATGSSWGTVSSGAAALAASITTTILATGTAGYARLVKSGYTLQGSVGTAATDFILDTVSLVASGTSTLTSATISL